MKLSYPKSINWYADEVQAYRDYYYNSADGDKMGVPPALVTSMFYIAVMLRRICGVFLMLMLLIVAAVLMQYVICR